MLLNRDAFSVDPIANLRLAAAIELATIPPYLYAAWSIRPREDGGSFAATEAARLIRSVAYEEMLHLALLVNVINALGKTVRTHVPTYPGPLPGHVTTGPYAFSVSLEPLSENAIDTFMKIELPEWLLPPSNGPLKEEWITLGAFYRGLQAQLQGLPDSDFANGRQLPPSNNPSPAVLTQVHDSASAVDALQTIISQGEGASKKDHHDRTHELAHYYKFKEIKKRLEGGEIEPARDVYPVLKDPRAASYDPTQQELNRQFNTLFSALLDSLQASYESPAPDVYRTSTVFMNPLPQVAATLRGAGTVGGTDVAGPTFEYLTRESRKV